MTDTTPVAQGIAAAVDDTNGPEYRKEKADVGRWFKRIERARKFDAPARKQYAIDRRYARGDSGFEVDDNLLGTFIDILVAFLYARDPDVDVLPSRSMEPPSLDALRDSAEEIVAQEPQIEQQAQLVGQQASWQALAVGQDPTQAGMAAAEVARQALTEQAVLAKFEELRERYSRRQRDNKAFAETLELVVSRLFKDGKLKARARTLVRSALTIGPGWLKASWQERTAQDPKVLHRIADLKENIAKAAAQKGAMEKASGEDLDVLTADYERQLRALEGTVERVVARGFAIDFVAGEDLTVAEGIALVDYLDSPWISHRVPMPIEDIVAEYQLDEHKAAKLTRYSPRKPQMKGPDSANVVADQIDEADADAFVAYDQQDDGTGAEYGMVEEVWDRDTNSVLTTAHGLECWLKPAYAPNATSRFYPFFLMVLGEIDGQRHPQSLVSRSAKLIDQYNRMATQEAEHRRRIKPKMLFHAGVVGSDQVTKVIEGATGEYVGVETTMPNVDLRTLFVPVQYPQLDPMLYDRSRIVQALERLWGIQEALSQSISTEKTATEAEIQQTGFQARTGAMRGALEDVLSELALYTAEVALQNMTDEDVRAMVGPDAMWPEWQGPESLPSLVNVEIRAGSSGKPNTSAEREAWASLLPLLDGSIDQIATLRNSDPLAIADSKEELLRITADRSGDRIDIDALVPQVGVANPLAQAGAPADPTADPANPEPQPQQPPVAA